MRLFLRMKSCIRQGLYVTCYDCEKAKKFEKKIIPLSLKIFCPLRISELYLKQDELDFFASDVLLIRNLKECTPWREASTSSDLS